jgi:hypothetical protein
MLTVMYKNERFMARDGWPTDKPDEVRDLGDAKVVKQ